MVRALSLLDYIVQFYKLAFYTHPIMDSVYADNRKISTIYIVRELLGSSVVYFNQQAHAYFSSCILHEPLVHMMKKVLFSSFSNVFLSFLTMRTHAQACIRWSKYSDPIEM